MEGCGYRDLQDALDAAGARIIGVSFDAPETNAACREKKGFTFDLWTDEGRELALLYGAATDAKAKRANRITRLLGPDGTVALEYKVGAFDIRAHPERVLEDVRRLFPLRP